MQYNDKATWLDRNNSCGQASAEDGSSFIMPLHGLDAGWQAGLAATQCDPGFTNFDNRITEHVCADGQINCEHEIKIHIKSFNQINGDRKDPQYICKKKASPVAPNITYWHNYNQNGHSSWAECSFSQFQSKVVIPGLAPFWTEETDLAAGKLQPGSGIMSQKLVVLPADYSGDWHPDPQVQLNLFVSGSGMWTTEDGVERAFKAGDFYLGDDAGTKGHLSKSTSDAPMVMLCTQFNVSRTGHPNTPCWL